MVLDFIHTGRLKLLLRHLFLLLFVITLNESKTQLEDIFINRNRANDQSS